MNEGKEAYLSIDIKSTGKEVIAIGAFFVGSDGVQVEKGFYRLIPTGGEFDKIRYEMKFWRERATLLKMIDKRAREDGTPTEKDMVQSFFIFLSTLEKGERKINFISDNPKFDLVEMDKLLQKHCGRKLCRGNISSPITFIKRKTERGCRDYIDPYERLLQIDEGTRGRVMKYVQGMDDDIPEDHSPENGAHRIYLQLLASLIMKEIIEDNIRVISLALDCIEAKASSSTPPKKMTSTSEKGKSYLTVDIESTGKEVIAIGVFFVGSDKSRVKRTFCRLVPERKDFDKQCYDEFWADKEALLDRIDGEAKRQETETEKNMTLAFASFLDELEKKEKDIELITDNSKFDPVEISDLLKKYCGRKPLWYTSDGKYRGDNNPDERLHQIGKNTEAVKKTMKHVMSMEDEEVVHDHWPENDAHYIYLQYRASNMLKEALAIAMAKDDGAMIKEDGPLGSALKSLMIEDIHIHHKVSKFFKSESETKKETSSCDGGTCKTPSCTGKVEKETTSTPQTPSCTGKVEAATEKETAEIDH